MLLEQEFRASKDVVSKIISKEWTTNHLREFSVNFIEIWNLVCMYLEKISRNEYLNKILDIFFTFEVREKFLRILNTLCQAAVEMEEHLQSLLAFTSQKVLHDALYQVEQSPLFHINEISKNILLKGDHAPLVKRIMESKKNVMEMEKKLMFKLNENLINEIEGIFPLSPDANISP
jgi:hypothetical protein